MPVARYEIGFDWQDEAMRLERLLKESRETIKRQSEFIGELQDQLGRAEAGMEMADLIKRMMSAS